MRAPLPDLPPDLPLLRARISDFWGPQFASGLSRITVSSTGVCSLQLPFFTSRGIKYVSLRTFPSRIKSGTGFFRQAAYGEPFVCRCLAEACLSQTRRYAFPRSPCSANFFPGKVCVSALLPVPARRCFCICAAFARSSANLLRKMRVHFVPFTNRPPPPCHSHPNPLASFSRVFFSASSIPSSSRVDISSMFLTPPSSLNGR